ncbi:MAG: DUF4912 domain-containing protein [Nitrospirota bacterium]
MKKAATKKITKKTTKKRPAKKKTIKKTPKTTPKTAKKVTTKRKETKKVKAKTKEKKTTTTTKKVKVKAKIEKKPKKVAKKVITKIEKKVLPKAIKKVEIKKITKIPEKYPPMPWEALPAEYGEDSITLMTVDPRRLFTYWEVREDTLARYLGILNIRVYDVTGVDFDGMNANSYFDIAVNEGLGEWYINVTPEKEFIADIGCINPEGIFITIARSNKVLTPRAAVAEEGILPERLYETGLPIGYKK